MIVQQISLYYKDGKSDKVYHCQIEEVNNQYLVNFQYGRRDSTLTAGSKTKDPVDLATAQKTYAKIVTEKTSKGYTEGDTGAIFQSKSLEERISGIVPQLLNTINDSQLEHYLTNDDWFMQEKFDGRRLMVKHENNEVTAINKKGLTILIPEIVSKLIQDVNSHIVVDGELIGNQYYIFDILEYQNKDVKVLPAKERYSLLSSIESLKDYIVPTYFNTQDKKAALELLRVNKKEGGVFKLNTSAYVAGRPASGGNQLKFKFWESATVQVISQHKTKRSVGVAAFQDGKEMPIGSVTIPANYDIPNVGDFVEVIYLYCHENGSLYQSKYKGVRDDQDVSDCDYTKLKFKVGNDDEEEEEAVEDKVNKVKSML